MSKYILYKYKNMYASFATSLGNVRNNSLCIAAKKPLFWLQYKKNLKKKTHNL